MDIQKIVFEQFEDEDLQIGLVRLVKKIPHHEFFFNLNKIHDFQFSRIENLLLQGQYFDYEHVVFEGYDWESKVCFRFISNQSIDSFQKKEITELFVDEQHINYLLKNSPETEYIIKTKDNISDFSLISLPKNLAFPVQEIFLSSHDELFHTLQYYE